MGVYYTILSTVLQTDIFQNKNLQEKNIFKKYGLGEWGAKEEAEDCRSYNLGKR